MGRTFIETTALYKSKIKKIERDHLVANIQVHQPYSRRGIKVVDGKVKKVTKRFSGIEKDVIVPLDKSNANLLEKVNLLKKGDNVFLEYHIPTGVDIYNPREWQLLDILNDIDMLELSNKNCLITEPVPKMESIIQPRKNEKKETKSKEKKPTKKDIEIAELKEKVSVLQKENEQLKSQLQLLQKQLEEKANANQMS